MADVPAWPSGGMIDDAIPDVPEGEDLNEYVASRTIDFYNDLVYYTRVLLWTQDRSILDQGPVSRQVSYITGQKGLPKMKFLHYLPQIICRNVLNG